MTIVTKTLKLPFFRLNQSKAADFERLQALNTKLGNRVLDLPKKERRALTTKSFKGVEIGSAWANQTIRNANAKTKVKKFKCLPLETNNQNWTLHKVGDTYSVAFGLVRGVKKRVPLQVHPAVHQPWLDALLDGSAKQGSLKLFRSRRGIWYALISASRDVPEAADTGKWIGVDRGQNIPAVVALPDGGRLVFFKAKRINHQRRVFAKRRKKLQRLGKYRAVKKLEHREQRTVAHINHKISKEIVGLAERTGCGIRLEDLSGIRQASKQRKETKSDNGQNRDYWPFYQLETFVGYKAAIRSIPVEKTPAAYTSKTHHVCGRLGVRKGNDFYCPVCDKHEHADGNAARNIGAPWGMFCAWEPSKGSSVMDDSVPAHGPNDEALNLVRKANPLGLALQEQESYDLSRGSVNQC
jgi:putative transposase